MPRKQVIISVVLVIAAVALIPLIFLLGFGGEEITITTTAEFNEFDESSIYVDADGNASCSLVMQLPPSHFSSFMKQITSLIGADIMKESYEESIRNSFARVGLEVENVSCDITGFDAQDNFKIVLTWETPKLARWSDNKWTINFGWVDNQSAAKEIISGEESTWTLLRSVAKSYGIDIAFYRYYYRNVTVLPEGAENVVSESFGSYDYTDYGGGSYGEGNVYLGEVDGKPVAIENSVTLTATENEITITPEQLLAIYSEYTLTYQGVSPENSSFTDSLEQVRLDLKFGRELSDHYSVYSGGSWYSLSPAQLLYYTTDAVTKINQGNPFSIQSPVKNVAQPGSESGVWDAFWENLSKTQYVSLAQAVLDNINSDEVAPGYAESSIGKIRYRDILYTFTRILSAYGKSGELPDVITFVSVPSGELDWGGNLIPAENTYYLLPDTYVITDTTRVNGILDNLRDSLDNRGLAEEICNWTGSNISYGLSFTPPTSEEVLISRQGQCRDYTNVYLAMTRTAGIPTRRVSGWVESEWQPPAGWEFNLTTTPEGKTVANHAWVQVYLPGEGWVPLEPQSARPALYVGTLPYDIYRQVEQSWTSALAGYETGYGLL